MMYQDAKLLVLRIWAWIKSWATRISQAEETAGASWRVVGYHDAEIKELRAQLAALDDRVEKLTLQVRRQDLGREPTGGLLGPALDGQDKWAETTWPTERAAIPEQKQAPRK
jgi:hypothetical protein